MYQTAKTAAGRSLVEIIQRGRGMCSCLLSRRALKCFVVERRIRNELIDEATSQQKVRVWHYVYGKPLDAGQRMVKDYKTWGQIMTEGSRMRLHGPNRHFEIMDRMKENARKEAEMMNKAHEEAQKLSDDLGGQGGMGVPEAVRILQLTEDNLEHINTVRFAVLRTFS